MTRHDTTRQSRADTRAEGDTTRHDTTRLSRADKRGGGRTWTLVQGPEEHNEGLPYAVFPKKNTPTRDH